MTGLLTDILKYKLHGRGNLLVVDLQKQEWLHSHQGDLQCLLLTHSPPESLFAPETQSGYYNDLINVIVLTWTV